MADSPQATRPARDAVFPDILGEPWVSRVLPVTPSRRAPGADHAVLVHHRRAAERALPRAVVYLPGFVDYFYQAEHAQAWVAAGVEFYGLDMRGQGRAAPSRLEEVWDLTVRFEEVARAITLARESGAEHVTLLGHSTGGLLAAHFAAEKGGVDALVLNSPWLALTQPAALQRVARVAAALLGRAAPRVPLGNLTPEYPRSVHASTGGEFNFDTTFKVLVDFPARAGFLASVMALQRRIEHHGLPVTVPILVAASDRFGSPRLPADLTGSDVVLNPADMRRLAPRLGTAVELRSFPGGLHDLALSPRPIRDNYTAAVIEWSLRTPAVSGGAQRRNH